MNAGQAQPLAVVTEWGVRGAIALAALLLAIAVAGAFYRRAILRAQPLPLSTTASVAALASLAAWFSPVLFSSDVYAYAAYGELARLGLDPYVHAAIARGDPLLADANWQWAPSTPLGTSSVFPVCVYGPAFVALAKAIVIALAPFGTLAQLDGMRVTAVLALLACIPLAYAAYRGDRAARLLAAATIGLNPVALWCAVEGHNDALALCFVLAGFALARTRSAAAGAAVVALSSLIKLPGAGAAIALAAVNPRARVGAAVGIAIAAAISMPLLRAVATQVAPHGAYAPAASVAAILAPFGAVPASLFAIAVAAALAFRGIAHLRSARADGWLWLGIAAWALIPNPYPWYALWLTALAAGAPRTRAAAVALLLGFTSLLRYVPDAVATPSPPLAAALGIAASLPLLGALRS